MTLRSSNRRGAGAWRVPPRLLLPKVWAPMSERSPAGRERISAESSRAVALPSSRQVQVVGGGGWWPGRASVWRASFSTLPFPRWSAPACVASPLRRHGARRWSCEWPTQKFVLLPLHFVPSPPHQECRSYQHESLGCLDRLAPWTSHPESSCWYL